MRTRLTDLLDIELPVMLAGMGGVSYSDLVAAVSDAGGIGTFGAAPMSTELLIEEMARVRTLTNKPFGVDLLTASPDSVARNVKAIIEGGARIYVAGLGVPREVIDELHKHNILVGSMCGKVRHAVAAVASGCDFVVAQGTEAGGHTGTVATMALVPQVVDAVGEKVPVVAAGGIFDGRGLAAALALGADGVWVGTRFIATNEAHTGQGFKEKMVEINEDDTVISRAYTGKTCRVIRTEWTQQFEEHPENLKKFPEQVMAAMSAGVQQLGTGPEEVLDTNRAFMACGQAAGAVKSIVPARQIVEEFMDGCRKAISRLNSLG
jgi:enoyl-[acyl-carrier protein] reductase II